jgi:hypothetical protein
MKSVRRGDSVRRAFQEGKDEESCTRWTRKRPAASCEPLLTGWRILDVDATVKPLYVHQKAAVKGYNEPRIDLAISNERPFPQVYWLGNNFVCAKYSGRSQFSRFQSNVILLISC